MTQCTSLGLVSPIKFLGLTVLSFNGTLGWGTQESSLSVDLIADCEAGQIFNPSFFIVGSPKYFPDAGSSMGFTFNGILTNWTRQKSSSGLTYNVKLSDPRQLLENAVVITDTYSGDPISSVNYFNVYRFLEEGTFEGSCANFGQANASERGMPYNLALPALQSLFPTIYSPTGFAYTLDLSLLSAPAGMRIAGPSITILQLVQDLCDTVGADFYVTLEPGNVIKVYPVQLIASNVSSTIASADFMGVSTELSYGQELRNEKVKTVLFGEKQHYLVPASDFDFYFGEDKDGNPIVPIDNDDCGFRIDVSIQALNASLLSPFPADATTATISEIDIRAALSSYEMWRDRALIPNNDISPPGSLNKLIQDKYSTLVNDINKVFDNIDNFHDINKWRSIPDRFNQIWKQTVESNKTKNLEDLKRVHDFVVNFGNTFYGKQFITPLPTDICVIDDPEVFRGKIYSANPTNDGGWFEGEQLLGLNYPEIGFFAQDDGRIGAFAFFSKESGDIGSGVGPSTPSTDEQVSAFFGGAVPPTPSTGSNDFPI